MPDDNQKDAPPPSKQPKPKDTPEQGPRFENSSSTYTILIDKGILSNADAKPRLSFDDKGNLVIQIGPLSSGLHTMDTRQPPAGGPMPKITVLTLKLNK
jgi:hypothetical protein